MFLNGSHKNKQRKTCFKNLFREVFDVLQTESKNWDIENCVWKPNNPNFCSRKTCLKKLKIFNFLETSFSRTKIRVIWLPYTIFDIPVFVFCLRNIKNFTKQILRHVFLCFFVASIKKHTIETSVFVFLFVKHAIPLKNLFRKLCSQNKFGKFVF